VNRADPVSSSVLRRREFLAGATAAALQRGGAGVLVDNSKGRYRFVRGIAPYSSAAVAMPGYEVVHATLDPAPPYRRGFERVDVHLRTTGRPAHALCGIELRSPRPFTFQGFIDFNREYIENLRERDILLGDLNPVARTNVAPELAPPAEVSLYGFSYTAPAAGGRPTFVVAGAGELSGDRLAAEEIVRRGDVSPAGLAAKASHVLDLMDARLRGLGVGWRDVTAVGVYTIHDVHPLLGKLLLQRAGAAALHGIRWHFARPPIEEIEFEMDLRGTRQELVLPG